MPNLNLPTNVVPGVTDTFEANVEAAWAELNRLSFDTGERNITSLLQNSWAATALRIRRVVDEVTIQWDVLNGSAATGPILVNFSALPGFAPVGGSVLETDLWRTKAGGTAYLRLSSASIQATPGLVFPDTTRHIVRYRTLAALPNLNALPGIPG